MEEVKPEMAEALKGINTDEFKNCFEQWKKVLIGVLHEMESALKVTKIYMCQNTYTIFNK